MVKTSIDGLAVRSSRPAKNAIANTRPRRIVGGVLVSENQPRKRPTATARTQSKPKIDSLRRTDDDFLGPVGGLEITQDQADDGDWSSLLDQLDDRQAKSPKTRDESDDAEVLDEPKSKRKSKARKLKMGKRHLGRKIALAVLLLLVVAGGVLYFWGDSIIARITSGNSGLFDTIWSLVSETVPFETDSNGRTNVLIFGTEGYDMNGNSGGKTHDGSQLTDSIMVVSFDQKTKDVALISLPRDLRVPRSCGIRKINEVFQCNNQQGTDEAAGAAALMDQASQVLGIDFQYWAHVNWGSLVNIVDTIGGIMVTLDEDINDYNYTKVVIKAGVPTYLTGEQAVGLSRARHGTDGGDFTRGASQQKIVEGIAQKLIESNLGLTEIFGLVNILGDNLRSNFSADNIKAGFALMSGFDLATGLRNIPLIDYNTWQFRYITTGMVGNYSYVLPADERGQAMPEDYRRIQAYVARMLSSNPAVREGASLIVLNASGETGLASTEKIRLEADDFDVIAVGDAAPEDCTEMYCLYTLNNEMSGTKAALEQRYGVTAKSAGELPMDVQPGTADFVVILGQNPNPEAAEQ